MLKFKCLGGSKSSKTEERTRPYVLEPHTMWLKLKCFWTLVVGYGPNDCRNIKIYKIDCTSNRHKNTSNWKKKAKLVPTHCSKWLSSILPQPPYRPDLFLPDFFLFSRLKYYLKGHRFGNLKSLHKNVKILLNSIPVKDFHSGTNEWQSFSNGVFLQGESVLMNIKCL